jgi:hypothetical protein
LVKEEAGIFYQPEAGLSIGLERAAAADLDQMGFAALQRAGELSWDRIAMKTVATYELAAGSN